MSGIAEVRYNTRPFFGQANKKSRRLAAMAGTSPVVHGFLVARPA